jgi:hypothetical protein
MISLIRVTDLHPAKAAKRAKVANSLEVLANPAAMVKLVTVGTFHVGEIVLTDTTGGP